MENKNENYLADVGDIRSQYSQLLFYMCQKYNNGISSSIRTEVAESILQSIMYTITLYHKSFPEGKIGIEELKRGQRIVSNKTQTAKYLYRKVLKNKIYTHNHAYNATLSHEGIGEFFRMYDPSFQAHECPASIDYQLCVPVFEFMGVEFIQMYLEHLYLENEFCQMFPSESVHYLLYGYDVEYNDLLINVFEHILTSSLASILVNRNPLKLVITKEDLEYLKINFAKDSDDEIFNKFSEASEKLITDLPITNKSLEEYIRKSLPKITSNIRQGIKSNHIDKVFIVPKDPKLRPKIVFVSEKRMDDKKYREVVEELRNCRYSSDKYSLIMETIKSFDDLESIFFDGNLNEEEIFFMFSNLQDLEIAELVKRNAFLLELENNELMETEANFRQHLKKYLNHLSPEKRLKIYENSSILL